MANKAKNQSEKYIDLISQGAEESQQEQNEFANEEARLQVDGAIHETKKALAAARRELNAAKKAVPYSLENEVDKTQKVNALEEGLALSEAIKKSRF